MLVAIRCAPWTKMCGGLDSDDGPVHDVPHLKRSLLTLWGGHRVVGKGVPGQRGGAEMAEPLLRVELGKFMELPVLLRGLLRGLRSLRAGHRKLLALIPLVLLSG